MTSLRLILSVAAIVVMAAGSVAAADLAVDDTGLLFYYGFESMTGTTVTDGSDNGYDGLITNNVTQVAGAPVGDYAADFWDETNDDWGSGDRNHITLPVDSMTGMPSTAASYAAWYKVPSHTDNQMILSVWGTNGNWSETYFIGQDAGDYSLYRLNLRDAGGDDIVEITYGGAGASEQGPRWDTWVHLAATYDEATHTARLYENGVLIQTDITTNNNDIDPKWGDQNESTDGSSRIGNEGDGCRQNFGKLDEVYVFSRVLTPAEIKTLATASLIGDADLDNDVDADDTAILAENWLTMSDATWQMGDFNGDYRVDDIDATMLANNWTGGLAAVPEPSSLVLLIGLVGLLSFIRRRIK